MTGRAGAKGYLLQTFITLLESLRNKDWTSLQMEPGGADEKADVLWRTPSGTRAVQIRHSMNQLTVPIVRGWAEEFEAGVVADAYELRLAGPASGEVAKGTRFGRVEVPQPLTVVLSSLVHQAAHQIDVFFEGLGVTKVPAFARELVVGALATRLSEYSTSGQEILREDFRNLLASWILALYPVALNQAAEDLRAGYEERLERMRAAIRQEDRVAEARYSLKHAACLEALSVIDEVFAHGAGVEAGRRLSPFELGEKARACHSRLVVACDSPDVVAQFRRLLGFGNDMDAGAIVDFRAAVRAELGFGHDAVDEDRENAFIGTAGGDFTLPLNLVEKIAALRGTWGRNDSDQ